MTNERLTSELRRHPHKVSEIRVTHKHESDVIERAAQTIYLTARSEKSLSYIIRVSNFHLHTLPLRQGLS